MLEPVVRAAVLAGRQLLVGALGRERAAGRLADRVLIEDPVGLDAREP